MVGVSALMFSGLICFLIFNQCRIAPSHLGYIINFSLYSISNKCYLGVICLTKSIPNPKLLRVRNEHVETGALLVETAGETGKRQKKIWRQISFSHIRDVIKFVILPMKTCKCCSAVWPTSAACKVIVSLQVQSRVSERQERILHLDMAESYFQSLLGDNLMGKSGEVKTENIGGEGKTVGLYFSAHWCPPCRGFTPKLAEFYKKYHKDKNFEIVFVSSDKDENQFKGYYDEMPWLALPYKDREKKVGTVEIACTHCVTSNTSICALKDNKVINRFTLRFGVFSLQWDRVN